MKIVWFTPSPITNYGATTSGAWISSMYYSLLTVDQFDIINIVLLSLPENTSDGSMISLNSKVNSRQKPDNKIVQAFKNCIIELKPDLIHIWGTEWNGAYLVSKAELNIPVLVSIQGIASIIKHYVKGTRRISVILKWLTPHDLIAPSGLLGLYRGLKKSGVMELFAVKKIQHFECATPYMEAWIRSINPEAKIYSCPSVLRPHFYNFKWDINKISRYSLLLPDAFTSYKGFDVILKAAKILVKEFPLIQIRVAGTIPRSGFIRVSGFERYINHLIKNYNVENNVIFLGPLTSEKLSQEMLTAHGVVISSLIESQCLVLLESMMLGVPTVASYSGGMPDLFTNLQNAIGYPVGDYITLSHAIRQLFNNDTLARDISGKAYHLAHRRNNLAKATQQLISIYNGITNHK